MRFMDFQGPNFIMQVPSNWMVTSSPQFQALFLGPVEVGIRPNFAVSLRPLEAGVTVQAIAAEARKNQAREYPEYTIVKEIDYTKEGGKAFYREYTWFNPNESTHVFQSQTFVVVAQVLFTLTATRAEPMNGHGEDVDRIFQHMVESFRVQAT